MEYKIGICDEDYHYILNLMEYINSKSSIPMRLVAFSTGQAIEEYMDRDYLDGLIIGESINIKDETNIKIFLMVEDDSSGVCVSERNGYITEYIYKYQAADRIAEILISNIGTGIRKIQEKSAMFIGVYSPIGRSGKTTFSKALCVFYTNCLYVGLQEYSNRDETSEQFMYCLVEESSQLLEVLQGVCEISGILSYMDIRQLKRRNIEWLKKLAVTELNYNRIIFDIGVGVLEDLDVLLAVDVVYVPVLQDDASRVKLGAFKEVLRQEKYKPLEEKIIYVEIPCVGVKEVPVELIIKGGG